MESAQLLLRRKIAEELLHTEKTYVQSLGVVAGLRQALLKHKVLSEEDMYSIFSNVSELLQLHTELLSALQAEAKNWNSDVQLGKLFLEKVTKIRDKTKIIVYFHKQIQTVYSHA